MTEIAVVDVMSDLGAYFRSSGENTSRFKYCAEASRKKANSPEDARSSPKRTQQRCKQHMEEGTARKKSLPAVTYW